MKKIVFYSWQSDLPNPCNRGFIQKALEDAAVAITDDNAVAIEPVVDRDTQGVAGAPDIAATIFAKITSADVFIADVSIISRQKNKRPTPNPNVLIELGYALKAIGHERIILVFNTAYGEIAELPFDLRTRRLMIYNMPETTQERASERTSLQAKFDSAIRSALEHSQPSQDQPSIPAVSAIENGQMNRISVLRKNLNEILQKIITLQPKKHSDGGTVDDLLKSIDQTQESVAEFSKISETVALINDQEAAKEITHFFGSLFERYDTPKGFSGKLSSADFDFYKFVGHELFTTFVAFLLKENRWETLNLVLQEPIPMNYIPNQGSGHVYWDFASEHLPLLLDESKKRNRISAHADILHERHDKGGLSSILPFNDFVAADFFLFLRGESDERSSPRPSFKWRPWSGVWLQNTPSFLSIAEGKRFAENLRAALNAKDIDELKGLLNEYIPRVTRLFGSWWDQPIQQETIDKIGTR